VERISSLLSKLDRFVNKTNLTEQEYIDKKVAFYWLIFNSIAVFMLAILAYLLDAFIILKFGFVMMVLILLFPELRWLDGQECLKVELVLSGTV
jgi:hypothetical protein